MILTISGHDKGAPSIAALRVLRDVHNNVENAEAWNMLAAMDAWSTVEAEGWAVAAEDDSLTVLKAAADELEAVGFDTSVWDSREFAAQAFSQPQEPPQEATEADPEGVPSPEAFQAALAAMATLDGNPLRAAAHLTIMARAVGQEQPYQDAISALIHVFPWIHGPLVEQGFIE